MKIKHVLFFILALTAMDAACTAAGLRLGAIEERNPLLCRVMTAHPVMTGAAVCMAVTALMLWLYSVRERVRWIGPALIGVAAVKIGILALHLQWIFALLPPKGGIFTPF